MAAEPAVHDVRLRITTDTERVMVSFEPTGMEYELTPGRHLDVAVRGPGSGLVEVDHRPDRVVVGAWAEAQTFVWDEEGRPLPV